MSGEGVTFHDPTVLPGELPAPRDDGACGHLPGRPVPGVSLPATDGRRVDLSEPFPGRTVVYVYPRTGRPGVDPPAGWDLIPGARGCTPETCGFRDRHTELEALGARTFGLSTQTTDYQREMAERLQLNFPVLSDADLDFARRLRLPTFEVEGTVLIKRLTLVIRHGRVEHVFYPVFPPDTHADTVVNWLTHNPD